MKNTNTFLDKINNDDFNLMSYEISHEEYEELSKHYKVYEGCRDVGYFKAGDSIVIQSAPRSINGIAKDTKPVFFCISRRGLKEFLEASNKVK